MSRNILLVFLTVFLLTFSFGAEMWFDFQNHYATDGNGTLKVFVDADSDGVTDADYDINASFYDFDGNLLWNEDALTTAYAGGTYANFEIDLNFNGDVDLNGIDYNIVIEDLNDLNTETDMEFFVPEFKDVDINWHNTGAPKIDISDGNDLNFNFVFYDVDGAVYDFNGTFKVFLYNPQNTLSDTNFTVTGEETVSIPYEDFNTMLGKYKLLIGGEDSTEESMGYKTFTFDVLAFDLTAFVKNEFEESKSVYGTGDELELVIFANDLNGDVLDLNYLSYQIDTEAAVVVSDINTVNKIDIDTFASGKHSILVTGGNGDYNLTTTVDFVVASYSPEFFLKKNTYGGTKIFGIYAPDSTVSFLFGVKDLANGAYEAIDSNAECDNLFSALSYSALGFDKDNSVTPNDTYYNDTEELCQLDANAPSANGDYIYTLDLNNTNYSGVDLSAKLKLTVAKYMLYLQPTDSESAFSGSEENKKAHKFKFYDENIALIVKVLNLETGVDDLNVASVLTLQTFDNGTSADINSDYYDYNYVNKLLIIDKEGLNVSGDYELKATFDTNDVDMTAKIMLQKKVFNTTIDLNKTYFDGPPFVTPDENVELKVTAKNSSGNALEYATVTLQSLYNFETMENIALGSLTGDTNSITDADGIAYLNMGSGLETGMYDVVLDVNDGDNSDEAHGFFMVREFFSFAFPIEINNNEALENSYFGPDENLLFGVLIFGEGSGFSFEDTSEYEIVDGEASLFLETEDSEGQKKINATIEDLGVVESGLFGMDLNIREVQITPDGNLQSGTYFAMFDVNKGGTVDTGVTQFVVLAFFLQVCSYWESGVNCGESMFGGGPGQTTISPDSNALFVLNAGGGTAELTISLIDDKEGMELSGYDDLNFYEVTEAGTDFSDTNAEVDLSSNPNDGNYANDTNILVVIPADVPSGEYQIKFKFTNNSGTTTYYRSVSLKRFAYVVPSGQGNRELWYAEDWENGGFDSNIEDTMSWDYDCPGDNNFDVTGISYDRFVFGSWSGSFDYNSNFLADLDEQRVYMDIDGDCNFVDDLVDGNILASDKSKIEMDANTSLVVTNVTLTGLNYFLMPDDVESANSYNTYVGQFDLDRNINIPLVIQDSDGNPIADVQVTVSKVRRMDVLTWQMETMTEVTDYNVFNDNNSDANGIVYIKMSVADTGEYQLELTLSKDDKTEVMMPWEGPMFQVKKFQAEMGFVRQDRLNSDNGYLMDLNISPYSVNPDIELSQVSFVGIFDESSEGYDLDKDGSEDKNYYIYYSEDMGIYLIDDDVNFNNEIVASGMNLWGLSSTWPTCLGDYNSSSEENDCSGDSLIKSSLDPPANTISTDIMSYESKNGSFEDGNTNWAIEGIDIIIDDVNFSVGTQSVKTQGDWNILMNSAMQIPELNEDYNFGFCSFASQDTNVYASLYIEEYQGDPDVNWGYDFNTSSWGTIDYETDANQKKTFAVTSSAWTCFYQDVNVEDIENMGIKFWGDGNADTNYNIDAVQFTGDLTARTIVVYNKLPYRELPNDFNNLNLGLGGGDRAMWADSNNSPDTNHYLEVYFRNRDLTVANITDANVSATVIERSSCEDNGWMSMNYKGKYTGTVVTATDNWVFNFEDLFSTPSAEDECIGYEVRVDITTDAGYKDSTWNRFYIRNNGN